MKTIKMFQTVITIAVLSILAGCSDQFINPEINSKDIAGNESVSNETGSSLDNRYTVQVKLKPYRSFTFNSSNTGLKKINAINAESFSGDYPGNTKSINGKNCQDISVYSNSLLQDNYIDCKSSGLDLKEITVENVSSKMVFVNVTLTGVKDVTKRNKK